MVPSGDPHLFRRERDHDGWFPYLVLTMASGLEFVAALGRRTSGADCVYGP